MELQRFEKVGEKDYGVFTIVDKDTNQEKELYIPISPKEEQLQMSAVVMEVISYPEQLVVAVRECDVTHKYSFAIVRAVPALADKVTFKKLLLTRHMYASYADAATVLESVLRHFTSSFYDECADDERYNGDGFVLLNNEIVDWILKVINKGENAWVSHFFVDNTSTKH